MKVIAFFNLIRWKNLALIALMQVLIKIYYLDNFSFETALTNTFFYLLVISTTLLTASGYIINDIIDLKTDKINKPNKITIGTKISISTAKKLYTLLTFTGVLIGLYISVKIDKPLYATFFIEIIVLLYLYSKFLKGKVLIGNLVVSILLVFSIIIIYLFGYPINMNSMQWDAYMAIQCVLLYYIIFSFLLNLIREIIKDIEDIDGDYNTGLKTLPIVFGRKIARNFAIFLSFLTLFFLLFGVFQFIPINSIAFIYLFISVFLPLLYFIFRLWSAKNKSRYTQLSKLIKIIILLGILSIPIISNHLHNAIN